MDDLALYGSLPWESSPLTGNSLAVYPFSIAQSCVVILLNLAVVVAGIRSEMGFNAANVLSILMCAGHVCYGLCIFVVKVTVYANMSWSHGLCLFDSLVSVFFLTFMISTMAAMAAERYLCIVPMRKLDGATVTQMMGGVCVFSVGLALGHVLVMPKPVVSKSGLFCMPNFGASSVGSLLLTIIDVAAPSAYVISIIGVYSSILRHLRKTFRTLRIKSARQVDSRQHQQQQHPQQISDAAPGGTLHSPVHSGVSIRNEPLPPPPPLQIEATVVPQQLAKSPTQCTTGFTGSGPSLVSGDILNSVNCVESSTATSPKAREVVIQAPTTPISGMGTGSSFRGTMSLSGILRTTFSNPFSRTSTGVSSARSTGDSRVLNELAGKTRPPAHIAVLSINPVHLFLPEDAMRSPDGAGRGSSRSKQPRNKRPSQDDRGVTTEMDAANEQTILSIDVPALQAASFFEKSAAVPHASRDNDASPISLSSTGKRHPSHTGSLAAGKFKNPLRLVRQSVSLDGHHSGTPQAPASRTSSGRSLRLLKIEAQLLRRGFLIFCSFGVTWALFMTIVMSMYVTKQRCPPALDMATSIMLLLSPIIEPLIIIRTDRQWAKAMRELQCELLGMLGVPAWVFSSAAQSDSDGVVHGWH